MSQRFLRMVWRWETGSRDCPSNRLAVSTVAAVATALVAVAITATAVDTDIETKNCWGRSHLPRAGRRS